ncbi:MAG: archaellin/type IV pilin N-terminal domain-containing protein [Nanopusillaceae archaeon]
MELYFMKGQTGIGTLIVFIALVLTAAIAAFLITQTTVATQSKAAAVADQARERTGTTLEIVRVEGLVNNGLIDKYVLYIRLAPGSSPVNLNTLAITYYTGRGRETFKFGGRQTDESGITTADGYYYVLSKYSAEKAADNILEAGEYLAIGLMVNNTIGVSDWWRFSLIPKEGQPAEVYGVAPDVFVGNVVVLR